MAYNTLNITITQDIEREVECWYFSETPDTDPQPFLDAHQDVFDMFLCPQPLLVLPEKGTRKKGASIVSNKAKLVKPEFLTPPYPQFMLNTFAMEILDGKTIQERMAGLIELYGSIEEKEFLTLWLYELAEKGLYTVIACS